MIGKVVTGCVAILPYHTATQDRGSECRDFGFISRIVTALVDPHPLLSTNSLFHLALTFTALFVCLLFLCAHITSFDPQLYFSKLIG